MIPAQSLHTHKPTASLSLSLSHTHTHTHTNTDHVDFHGVTSVLGHALHVVSTVQDLLARGNRQLSRFRRAVVQQDVGGVLAQRVAGQKKKKKKCFR